MSVNANIYGFSLFGVVVLGWWCYYMNTSSKKPPGFLTSMFNRKAYFNPPFPLHLTKNLIGWSSKEKKIHFQAKIYTKDETFSHTLLLKQHRTLAISTIIRNTRFSGNLLAVFDSKATKNVNLSDSVPSEAVICLFQVTKYGIYLKQIYVPSSTQL